MRDRLLGHHLDGKYRLDELLAEGGMGSVYRGTHVELDRPVAIKLVRADMLEDAVGSAASEIVIKRFLREARAIARLNHPNIVRCYDFGMGGSLGAYLVMELLDGWTLKDELADRECLGIEEAVGFMLQVCAAIDAAHGANILHRDIKPGNIFLDEQAQGRVARVLDFGLAKIFDSTDVTSVLTKAGSVLGTAKYMSPEQCQGDQLDARSDQYSLGCVTYEMVAGSPPFVSRNAARIMAKHVEEVPRRPSLHRKQIPAALDLAILRALEKDPSSRFASVAEFASALALAIDLPT